jgi:hypothetical protein
MEMRRGYLNCPLLCSSVAISTDLNRGECAFNTPSRSPSQIRVLRDIVLKETCGWRIDTEAVKRLDSRNTL